MKNIKIKSLRMLNFKGIRDMEVRFEGDTVSISGRNASGKTTIFDAFTYVLFGKDSKDRKDFEIKTLAPDGTAIPRIPHEVKCELDVDGETITLERRYCEKWTKRRGSSVEEFSGHEEERYYNGVPCSVKDFTAKIREICDETVFKFITNPLYFSAQKSDVQRPMLFRMAGEVSDADVAKGNIAFEELLSKLTGKSLEEYRREILARKRRVKESMDGIPARIDERRRDTPEPEDWSKLESDKGEIQAAIHDLDSQLTDMGKRMEARMKEKDTLRRLLYENTSALEQRRKLVIGSMMTEHDEWLRENMRVKKVIAQAEAELKDITRKLQQAESEVADLSLSREDLLSQWRVISSRSLEFNEDLFKCPTCGKAYDYDEIDKMRSDMIARFNAKKADDLEANKKKGLAVKARLEEKNGYITTLRQREEDARARLTDAKANPILTNEPALDMVSMAAAVENDTEWKSLKVKETELLTKMNEESGNGYDSGNGQAEDDAALRTRRSEQMARLSEINSRIDKREIIARNEARIAELERDLKALNDEMARLEGEENCIAEFGKAKASLAEERVNTLFNEVRFKLFDRLINGGEVEVCEATVGGVPFSNLNDAGRINAGLDIINAICRYEEVSAPIFIDNAESVLEPRATDSQQIRLYVADCELSVGSCQLSVDSYQ